MSRQDEKKHKTEQERETSVPKRKIIFVPLQSEKSPKGSLATEIQPIHLTHGLGEESALTG